MIFEYAGANCRTAREEQGDETEEFIKLFGPSLTYTAGARTLSGGQNWFLAVLEFWNRSVLPFLVENIKLFLVFTSVAEP
jgi:hypothetical protein